MKLNKFNIRLAIFLVLLIVLTGCKLPGLPSTAKGAISGRVLIPPTAKELSRDISGWVPAANAVVTIVDANGKPHTTTTDENGNYVFEGIAVKANTVVTAKVTIDGKTITIKDVIPNAVGADGKYNAGTMDPESTALALVVEELQESGLPVDLAEIKASADFKALVGKVQEVLDSHGNVETDADISDAVFDVASPDEEEPTPPGGGGTPTIAVTGVSVEPVEMYLELGKTATIIATVTPANATNKNVTWSSSNESIATVDGGLVTAITTGTATITATTVDKGFTATCVVEVIELISENADVTAGDFGVMDFSNVMGYNVGFILSDATGKDVEKVVVTLYKDGTVLATNTSTELLEQYPDATSLSAPFDVFGDFDYETDGCWDYSGWLGDMADIPTKAEINVTFKNGIEKIVYIDALSGDTSIFNKMVFNVTQQKVYNSIQDAIDDVMTRDILKLLSDIELDSKLVIADKELTLDLNDKTLSTPDATNGTAYPVLYITGNSSKITIKGPGIVQSDSGNVNDFSAAYAICVKDSAVLKVEEAIVKCTNSNGTSTILMDSFSGTLNLNGATIEGGESQVSNNTAGNAIYLFLCNEATINITDSEIIGGNGIVSQAAGGMAISSLNSTYTCNISQSFIKGGNSTLYNAGNAIDTRAGKFQITDSTVKGGNAFATSGNYGIGGHTIIIDSYYGNADVSIDNSLISGGDGGGSWIGCGIEYMNENAKLSIENSIISGGDVNGIGTGYGNALYFTNIQISSENVSVGNSLFKLGADPSKVYGEKAIYKVNGNLEQLLNLLVGEDGYEINETDGSISIGNPPTF